MEVTIDKAIPKLQIVRNALNDDTEMAKAYDMAIKALEQEPCTDAISRQAVLDLAKFDGRKDLGSIIHAFDVEQLPPVTPTEKVGQWIDEGFYADGHSAHAYRCSKCGEHYIGYEGEYKYCFNCGAKMEEVEE